MMRWTVFVILSFTKQPQREQILLLHLIFDAKVTRHDTAMWCVTADLLI
jgi:hypothetical protein